MNIDEYRAMVAAEKAKEDSKTEQPTEPTQKTTEQEETAPTPAPEPTPEPNPEPPAPTPTPDKLVIEGEEVTLEQVKEWRKGNLRQQDYTKKTQEVAHLRDEAREALELFDYLKANPQVAKALLDANQGNASPVQNVDPITSHVKKLEKQLLDLTIDREIDQLSKKYPDFDVREVLEMADRKKIVDLEDAYKMVKAEKVINTKSNETPPIDEAKIKEELRQQILRELEAEREATQTIISTKSSTPPEPETKVELTPQEKEVAKKLRLSDEEYIKWKNPTR